MLEGWKCSRCQFENDLLTSYCRICKQFKPDWITEEFQARIEIRRGIYIARIESYEYSHLENHEMTEQEELFAKFYNQEKILVKDMDAVALRDHRNELAKIAFEAKARLVATDEETRERNAKSKNGKEWLLNADQTQPNDNPDLINVPKIRAARMNKMEKMRKQLQSAGLDEDVINVMIREMERKATEKDVKAITFNKPTTEQAVVVVETKKPESNGEAFNPASLFGAK